MNEWWRGAVIYQIYPRSFMDTSGTGIGDLEGVRRGLDHVADLGVDAIWLSPFFPSPGKDHGYDVSDYCNVDSALGDLADFDALVSRAHDLGLKVVIDQVYSHTSDQHGWFIESRADRRNAKADWYVWADPKPDGTPPNNWLSLFGGSAWQWEPRRRQYYLHNFLAEQPDLNLHLPAVQDAILDVTQFWLDRGVDGFRLDVANMFMHDRQLRDNPPRPVPHGAVAAAKPCDMQWMRHNRSQPENLAFLRRFRQRLDAAQDRFSVAEIVSDHPVERMVEYVDGPDRFHTAYSFVLLKSEGSADFIRETVDTALRASATAWPSWAFSNHDVPRAASRWGGRNPDPALVAVLIAALTSLRGTAFLYQGEELGLPNADVPFERLCDPEAREFWPDLIGRDGGRTPMPWSADAPHAGFSPPSTADTWLPIDPRHTARAVDRQNAEPGSVLNLVRRFLAWRRGQSALRRGSIAFMPSDEPLLAFRRGDGADAVDCVFNLGAKPLIVPETVIAGAMTLPAPGSGLERCDGHWRLPGYGYGYVGCQSG